MIDKEMSGKGNMKEKDREKERDLLVSEHVAAITRRIGNLRIVDRRITPTTNRELISDHHRGRWENQERHLASLQNEDRVQGGGRLAGGRTKKQREREARKNGKMKNCCVPSLLSNDFALSKPQATV